MTLIDAMPDLFPEVPREARPRPHLAAARKACEEWRRRGARRNHPHYRAMIEHLMALTRTATP